MWTSRMFWRQFGAFGVLLLAALGLLGVVLVNRVEQQYLHLLQERLRREALYVQEIVCARTDEPLPNLRKQVAALHGQIDARLTLIDADGRVLADSQEDPAVMDNHAGRPEVREARQNGFGVSTRHSDTVGESMMYVALRTN